MKIGDLVKQKSHWVVANAWMAGTELDKPPERVGVIWRIGSPNPIARIVWTDGSMGAMHIKFLEVINEM